MHNGEKCVNTYRFTPTALAAKSTESTDAHCTAARFFSSRSGFISPQWCDKPLPANYRPTGSLHGAAVD